MLFFPIKNLNFFMQQVSTPWLPFKTISCLRCCIFSGFYFFTPRENNKRKIIKERVICIYNSQCFVFLSGSALWNAKWIYLFLQAHAHTHKKKSFFKKQVTPHSKPSFVLLENSLKLCTAHMCHAGSGRETWHNLLMKLLIEILFVCLIYETILRGGGATPWDVWQFKSLFSLCLTFISPTHTIIPFYIFTYIQKCLVLWRKNRKRMFFNYDYGAVCILYCEDVYFYAHCRKSHFPLMNVVYCFLVPQSKSLFYVFLIYFSRALNWQIEFSCFYHSLDVESHMKLNEDLKFVLKFYGNI